MIDKMCELSHTFKQYNPLFLSIRYFKLFSFDDKLSVFLKFVIKYVFKYKEVVSILCRKFSDLIFLSNSLFVLLKYKGMFVIEFLGCLCVCMCVKNFLQNGWRFFALYKCHFFIF